MNTVTSRQLPARPLAVPNLLTYGRIVAVPVGGTHFVAPDYDRGIEAMLRKHHAANGLVNVDHLAIGRDELCGCCNGGRLLPASCFEAQS